MPIKKTVIAFEIVKHIIVYVIYLMMCLCNIPYKLISVESDFGSMFVIFQFYTFIHWGFIFCVLPCDKVRFIFHVSIKAIAMLRINFDSFIIIIHPQGTTNHGATCSNNNNCYGQNVECYGSICMCTPGYSLKSDTMTCEASEYSEKRLKY